ncbi:unnamed protein product, partial [Candidula unifasciata]
DFSDTVSLLDKSNVNQDALMAYAREAANFSTHYQLPSLEYAVNHSGQADVAMFDFTSMFAAENASKFLVKNGHHLLMGLVGDSLLEPFWPTGSGCARGFLSAFDAAWMIRSWAMGKTPLQVLAERESIYTLLSQTTPSYLNKNYNLYSIDPSSRYLNLNLKAVKTSQVRHLYDGGMCDNWEEKDPVMSVPSKKSKSDNGTTDSRSLLEWCQKVLNTGNYPSVRVIDFTSSWRSGLAICALIHSYRPDLIDYSRLLEQDVAANNQLAFSIAEKELGIPPVMTSEDMARCAVPDKLTMISYLTQFYDLFRDEPVPTPVPLKLTTRTTADVKKPNSARRSNRRVSILQKLNSRIAKSKKRKEQEKNEGRALRFKKYKELPEDEDEQEDHNRLSKESVTNQLQMHHKRDVREGKYKGRESPAAVNVAAMTDILTAKFKSLEGSPHEPVRKLKTQTSLDQPPSVSDVCYFCRKRVYIMERVSAEGQFFHRSCLKCDHCGMGLRLTNYSCDRDVKPVKFYCYRHAIPEMRLRPQRKRLLEENNIPDVVVTPAEQLPREKCPPKIINTFQAPVIKTADVQEQVKCTPERMEYEISLDGIEESEEIQSEHNLQASQTHVVQSDEDVNSESSDSDVGDPIWNNSLIQKGHPHSSDSQIQKSGKAFNNRSEVSNELVKQDNGESQAKAVARKLAHDTSYTPASNNSVCENLRVGAAYSETKGVFIEGHLSPSANKTRRFRMKRQTNKQHIPFSKLDGQNNKTGSAAVDRLQLGGQRSELDIPAKESTGNGKPQRIPVMGISYGETGTCESLNGMKKLKAENNAYQKVECLISENFSADSLGFRKIDDKFVTERRHKNMDKIAAALKEQSKLLSGDAEESDMYSSFSISTPSGSESSITSVELDKSALDDANRVSYNLAQPNNGANLVWSKNVLSDQLENDCNNNKKASANKGTNENAKVFPDISHNISCITPDGSTEKLRKAIDTPVRSKLSLTRPLPPPGSQPFHLHRSLSSGSGTAQYSLSEVSSSDITRSSKTEKEQSPSKDTRLSRMGSSFESPLVNYALTSRLAVLTKFSNQSEGSPRKPLLTSSSSSSFAKYSTDRPAVYSAAKINNEVSPLPSQQSFSTVRGTMATPSDYKTSVTGKSGDRFSNRYEFSGQTSATIDPQSQKPEVVENKFKQKLDAIRHKPHGLGAKAKDAIVDYTFDGNRSGLGEISELYGQKSNGQPTYLNKTGAEAAKTLSLTQPSENHDALKTVLPSSSACTKSDPVVLSSQQIRDNYRADIEKARLQARHKAKLKTDEELGISTVGHAYAGKEYLLNRNVPGKVDSHSQHDKHNGADNTSGIISSHNTNSVSLATVDEKHGNHSCQPPAVLSQKDSVAVISSEKSSYKNAKEIKNHESDKNGKSFLALLGLGKSKKKVTEHSDVVSSPDCSPQAAEIIPKDKQKKKIHKRKNVKEKKSKSSKTSCLENQDTASEYSKDLSVFSVFHKDSNKQVKNLLDVMPTSTLTSKMHAEERSDSDDKHISHSPMGRRKAQTIDERIAQRMSRIAKIQQKQAEQRRLRMAQEIQRQLEEVEVKGKELEERGVTVEKALRGNSHAENETQLMNEWFMLVTERNALLRYESELLVRAKELELEDRQTRLEFEFREKSKLSEALEKYLQLYSFSFLQSCRTNKQNRIQVVKEE